MIINLKRAYDPVDEKDGYRILVDRLWPRGLKKEEVKIDLWLKDIAPTNELRKEFSHEVSKWTEFKSLYFAEIAANEAVIKVVIDKVKAGPVTLVYAAKDKEHNNAVVLKEYLENMGSD